MAFEATGIVHKVLPTEQVTEKFKKRVLVLTIGADTDYPQTVPFEFTQDNTAKLDDVRTGQIAMIKFDLRGREWTPRGGGEPKYFGSLQAWYVRVEGDGAPAAAPADDEVPF